MQAYFINGCRVTAYSFAEAWAKYKSLTAPLVL